LLLESIFETFTDVVDEGCFFCGSDSPTGISTDYENDHCVDVCSNEFITTEVWSSNFEVEDNHGCSNVILTALGDLVNQGWLQGHDATEFADGLVYDDRAGICFAYDPRDVMRRRLQGITPSDCKEMTCFDCAATAGKCLWDPNFKECQQPPLGEIVPQGLK